MSSKQHSLPAYAPQPGSVYERDGKKRKVVRLIPTSKFVSYAVEWSRPDQEMRTSQCSLIAWIRWATGAVQV